MPYEQCGKLLVATDRVEFERMEQLESRCIQNEIEIERLSETELKKREPNIRGVATLFVPMTGITDYKKITVKMDGSLVHDFLFAESDRSLHICNAPSPAATSAIPIGQYLCKKVKEKFHL